MGISMGRGCLILPSQPLSLQLAPMPWFIANIIILLFLFPLHPPSCYRDTNEEVQRKTFSDLKSMSHTEFTVIYTERALKHSYVKSYGTNALLL